MQYATLCFPVTGEPPQWVWLGLKKRGFGAGKITGIGGKIEPGESAGESAVREMAEEVGITIALEALLERACIGFFFPAKPTLDMSVRVFVISQWAGEPIEGSEVAPQQFSIDRLPFAHMWADAIHWLPLVLAGNVIDAKFTFADDNETLISTQIYTSGCQKVTLLAV